MNTTTTTATLVSALLAVPLFATAAQKPKPVPSGAEAISLLGKPLVAPPMAPEVRARHQERWEEAKRAYDRSPNNADSIIWLGRRTAYLGRYREAIDIYTRGIGLHPSDARLYRHRGHRYLTIRELGLAAADFERAYALVRGRPDTIEPDGMPNARGIPTSTLHSNIRYHLGLAKYLQGDFEGAAKLYREDVTAAVNPDMVVASSHWLYMALRRLGRTADAAKVLEPITASLAVIENHSYHRLLLMYKGQLPVDSLRAGPRGDDAAIQDVTVSYGIANWHLYNGRKTEAQSILDQILASPQWAAFGYLAAEAEVARQR